MSTARSPPTSEGMYSHLIDDEGSHGEFNHQRPDVGLSAPPVFPLRLTQRLSGPGPYRLATICLAALCAVLLISLVAVTAHYKNKPQLGGEAASELEKQTQDGNVSALISKVKQLQKEKDELLVRLAATRAPAPVTCPISWQLFNNSCYFISTIMRDWPRSQDFCQTQGGHLAIIHTAEEQTFLWNLLPRGHWNAYWFGLTDGETEDQWKWVDGTPLDGSFWEVGEPNNHIDEDCGYIVKTRVLERVAIRSWIDAPCHMQLPFICEKEMTTSPNPTTPH